ncbi:glycosyltransferase family 2 protein [Thermophilibacter immobilis]|uniref:Uncharacterized protein n=1 Tax=Thermophilibacter immobilis TaxID=2779519 RepID=A0A7S7M8I3_9ACTN|nr:hypothetical protein [Thermophilibacter immobilis]QOY60598.1 hypothetical protein INP52_09455 [Thermophilibacter immobilis]
MRPVIIIPSYWAQGNQPGTLGERGVYDYTTPIDKPLPELELCLASLEQVRGVLRVVVLVVAPPSCADSARARVNSICRAHASLNPLVIGDQEAAHVEKAVGRMAHHVTGETVSLRGYGAIKNMGLAVASVFGYDVAVFLDDDEVVLDPDFLVNAVYGLGSLTRQNLQILAKSGFFIDASGSPYAQGSDAWSEKYWTKADDFNRIMEKAQGPVRITRSNHMCGCCCALHAAAFTKIPFDPYITRGEDLDYLLNLRANGLDVWFDNAWCVRSQPPEEMAPMPSLFMQNVHRWLYEYRKLDAMNSRRDLRMVTRESLMPYPAPWLSSEVRRRVFQTALRRLIVGPDRASYLRILTRGRYEADKFARSSSSRYLSFAMVWPTIASALWEDRYLQSAILRTGEASGSVEGEEPLRSLSDPFSDTGAFSPLTDGMQ